MHKKLIVALDVANRKKALELVESLSGIAGIFKVGLQLFIAAGPDIIKDINSAGGKVFLDLKLFDIPNTVIKAIEAGESHGVMAMTMHSLCGPETLAKAARLQPRPKLWGVTVLTSFNDENLKKININVSVSQQVRHLAKMSKDCGLDGVICSPLEIGLVREIAGKDFDIVTPGVRTGPAADDQKRTLCAGEAVKAGADYLVIGRPIIEAPCPKKAAQEILKEMENA